LRASDSKSELALDELHVYSKSEPLSASVNMAVDEALFEAATAPTLRLYGWQQPSVSFGYFGRYVDAAAEAEDREMVRRWTGGGIVLHGADLTYSFILPAARMTCVRSSRAVYSFVHGAIEKALSSVAQVALAASDAPKVSDACFANAVVADVLVDGHKVAGAAQRRTRAGLLHQGSIQYEALPDEFPARFAAALCPHLEARLLSGQLLERAGQIAAEKYATSDWLRRR
jgi:lipoate-protein ligase A